MNALHLSVINDGDTYAARREIAAREIEGSIDAEEARRRLREICWAQARKEKRTGLVDRAYTKEEVYAAAHDVRAHMRIERFEGIATSRDKSKRIEVVARRWFDSVNGNSYFSLRIHVPQTGGKPDAFIYIPLEYGYGSQPEFSARDYLIEFGILEKKEHAFLREYGISFHDYGYGRKKDL